MRDVNAMLAAADVYEYAWQDEQVDPYADMFVILNYQVDKFLRGY